jgi:nitrite reductase/ring-hydroxylating ferredoxin subunit
VLSIEENERITRTGPGSPMGNLFRRFWIPAFLSSDLAESDCTPVRTMILGERLIAFRDSSGKLGILEERCPHRHASLYWGRNEEGGLRCAYHGWKFDTEGQCLDTPAEPKESRMKEAIHAISYDAHEAGGAVWVYMGPKNVKPPFPEFEWAALPADHVVAHKRLQECNYLQNLEGELDTAHLNFLHRSFADGESVMPPEDLARKHFYIAETGFGMIAMARSDEPNDEYYWRMTPFQLPSYTNIPGGVPVLTAAVPMDDTHMWGFSIRWDFDNPIEEPAMDMDVDPVTFLPLANHSNDYLRDLNLQKEGNFTGITGIRLQDVAVQEDQDGPICRRHEEHLGTTDRAIVGARRMLLQLAERLEQGIEPPQPHNAAAYCVRSVGANASRDTDPVEVWRRYQPERAASNTVQPAY